jgi:coenzyme PQQ synthesis protein D (PqqD)
MSTPPQPVDPVLRPCSRSDVVFRSVAGDWVIYDPRTRDLHVLNATAAAVWVCCDGSLSADGIAEEIAGHLEGAPEIEKVLSDVARALDRFREDGLLE